MNLKRAIFAALLLLISIGAAAQTKPRTESSAKQHTFSVRGTSTVAGRPMVVSGGSCSSGCNGILMPFTNTQVVPACASPTSGTLCYSGFTITDTTANLVIATPATLGPTATSFQYTPSGGLFFGTHTFTIQANGFDANGAPIMSAVTAASTTTFTNNLAALNPPVFGTPTGTP